MIYQTYGTLKSEVLIEADMEAEDFIQPAEVKTYFTDAIREARAHIMKLGLEDDYFIKEQKYSLTHGQSELTLPTDIYATKIRALTYSSPSKVYTIHRIKGVKKYEIMQHIRQSPSGGEYLMYDIENSSPTLGSKVVFYPESQETTTDCIILKYVRATTALVDDSSLVDIPEFYSFVKAYVKWKLYDKEGSPRAADFKQDYENEKKLMLDTLTEMTPDNYNNLLEADIDIYGEIS